MNSLSEDEKNLLELQERIMAGQQALARFTQQERLQLQRKQRSELTIRELSTMPDSTPMYKNVGKAYFLSNKKDVVQETEEDSATASKEVDTIRVQREVVQKKLKETETEFKELISQNPQLVRQLQGLRA